MLGGATLVNVVQSDGKTATTNNVPKYLNSSGLLIGDSGSKMTDKLSLDGSLAMTASLDFAGFDLHNTGAYIPSVTNTKDVGTSLKRMRDAYISGEILGPTHTRLVDNILSSTGATANLTVPVYNGTNLPQVVSSGILLSDKLNVDGTLAMTGDLDMGAHDVKNTGNILPNANNLYDLGNALSSKRFKSAYLTDQLAGAVNSRGVDEILSNPNLLSVSNNFPSFFDASGVVMQDSGTSSSTFLHVDGSSAMNGDLNLNTHDILNANDVHSAGYIVGTVNNVLTNAIVGNTSMTSVAGNIANFTDTSGVQVQDSGLATVDVFLRTGTIAMTGDLDMNSHEVKNCARYGGGPSSNFIGGDGATSTGSGNVVIGSNTTIVGTTNNTVCIGESSSSDGACVVGGASTGGNFTTVFGNQNTTGANAFSMIYGLGNTGTAQGAHIIGNGLTNNDAHTLLIGSDSFGHPLVNIRPYDDLLTDLGTPTNEFNTIYVNALDRNGSALNLGPSTASSVQLGGAAIPSVMVGKGYVASVRPIMSGGFVQTSNVTVGNTNVETAFIGAGVGSLTSVANSLSVGNASKMEGSGTVGITVGAQTLTFRLYGGASSTTLLATLPVVMSTLTASASWRLATATTVKSTGAGGTVQLNTVFVVNDLTPSQAYVDQTLASIDTTVNNVFLLTAQWTTANAANTITSNQFMTHSVYVV